MIRTATVVHYESQHQSKEKSRVQLDYERTASTYLELQGSRN